MNVTWLTQRSVPYPQPLFKVLQSRAVLVVEHARWRHNHWNSMCSRFSSGMAEVLKYRHIKGITLFNAFVTLYIDGKAWHQRVGTNLFQILQGFMVLFIKKTNLSFNWLYLWFVIYFCESSWDTLASSSLLLPMILSLINSFCFFSDIPFHADGSGLVVSMINWSSSSGRVIHKQYKILAVYVHSDRIRPYPFLCKPMTCSKDISCDKHGSHHRKIL